MADVRDKVVIVTGGGRGLGFSLATHLLKGGARVVVAEYDPDTVRAAAESLHGPVVVEQADVSDRDDVARVVDRAVAEYGAIDGLVNNAQAADQGVPFEEVTDAQLRRGVESGAFGSVRFMQAVFPHMRRGGGGSIVNVTSASSLFGLPGAAAYAASKGAIMALTRTAAREWGRHGIRVNAYAPAAMTEAMADLARTQPDTYASVLAGIPMGRLGDPLDDVAPAVAHLLSDDARYITGQMFAVDGGQYVSPM